MTSQKKSKGFRGMQSPISEQSEKPIRSYFAKEMVNHLGWYDTDSIQFILLSCHRQRALHGH